MSKIIMPRLDENVGEFVGIVLGDGNIQHKTIEITLENPWEFHYANYIKNLVYTLFKKNVTIRTKGGNSFGVMIYSRDIVEFVKKFGIKEGSKMRSKVKIPNEILNNKKALIGCIRGLVDTDGGIFFKQNGYKRALIEFKSFSKPLRKSFKKGLKKIGLTPSDSGSGKIAVRIQTQGEIKRYITLVGSSNQKNIIRFDAYIKRGIVPSKKELCRSIMRQWSSGRT